MLKTDLIHCERLVNYFDYRLVAGDEYQFFTDDRLLAGDGVFEKKVYRNGKRRTIKTPPVSLHSPKGLAIRDRGLDENRQVQGGFILFVVDCWQTCVTVQQKQFIENVLAGHERLYTKQQRYQYRRNIQKRLKTAYIGAGGEDMPAYRIGEYRVRLDLIRRFTELSDDNDAFGREIILNLDRDYITQIVYDRMTLEARKNIIACYQGNAERIDAVHLYAFYDVLLADQEKLENMRLC
jgi:hypothetical protein